MIIDPTQIDAMEKRYRSRTTCRKQNERLIKEGHPLQADTPERVEKFLTRRGLSATEAATVMRSPVDAPMPSEALADQTGPEALERVLGTNDLMGVAFLDRGLQVARTVGRIWVSVSGGRPLGYGTGFLISPRLLMTNHHVLTSASVARASLVEFNYQLGCDGKLLPSSSFSLDPDTFFFNDQHLDFALVAVQKGANLASYGWNPLVEEEGKAIVSQFLNIIQHPNGEHKQLCMRENQLVDVFDEFLHYRTDTAPGSSGSPVYNDRWEVVGLHHSGIPKKNNAGQVLAVDGRVWEPSMGEHRVKWVANEGVRVSRLLAYLRKLSMTQEQRKLFDEILTSKPPEPEVTPKPSPAPVTTERSEVSVCVAPDGTATWSIPLSVSVKVGGHAAPQNGNGAGLAAGLNAANASGTSGATDAPPALPAPASKPAGTDAESILAAAKKEFGGRADVLNVRLGYVFKNGWITGDRALVCTVRRKHAPSALREAGITALPESFMGMPVEVTNPSVEELVTLASGNATATEAFFGPSLQTDEITYKAPAGAPLARVVDKKMRVVAHVSPDAGWAQLSAFLAGVKRRLVVGMYDFGAPHIADAVEAAGQKATFKEMSLVMQRGESVGEGTKADDLTDDQVVEQLSNALGSKFENAWVKIGRVNGWVASSYHIKVAVRDQSAFWVSSGNWQSSNQPKGDPLGENPPSRQWLENYNREWHAVVEYAPLAKTFETYLLNDFKNNAAPGGDESLDLPDLLIPGALFSPNLSEKAAAFRYFKPFDEDRKFTVTPILSPDNYHEEVLKLVESAQDELLIQNQTFNAPGANHKSLRELMDAVLAKQRANVKVRVIFRVLFPPTARKTLEELKSFGFDLSNIRLQKNCHTKGVIADRERVLLGSQNWSNDGVSVNRDASLLFEDVPLAKYFAEIFEHDWANLASQDIGKEELAVELASASEKTPAGFVRINWKDYMEMQ